LHSTCITSYEKEKDEIRVKFDEDKVKMQKEKDQKNCVKEVVNKSVSGLAQEENGKSRFK
jgi:hypothetical protein